MRLGVLFSGGKDSVYALFKAMKTDDVVCLISIISKNKESYMFHTPNIDITELQAEAIGIPLLQQSTEGEKEEELNDLKKAIERAKKEYKIEGIVTGALCSNYQKERIEKICWELNLKAISPHWSMNQEAYMRETIKEGFKIIIISIAADGLNKDYLGKEIDEEMIARLVRLNKKNRINIAFEGGEAETFVIDCPLYNKKIKIEEAEIKMENECTGIYKIKKAKLVKK